MPHEAKVLLSDILFAANKIKDFLEGCTEQDLHNDEKLCLSIERLFEILGEALKRLHKINEDISKQISDYRHIIDFRNILAHGYDIIEISIIWNIATTKLDTLIEEVSGLLDINQ